MKHRADDEEIGPLANALRAYLAEHPQATDTLNGVCQWWIPRDKAYSPDTVMRAIQMLVHLEEVEQRPGSDGRIMYRKRPRA